MLITPFLLAQSMEHMNIHRLTVVIYGAHSLSSIKCSNGAATANVSESVMKTKVAINQHQHVCHQHPQNGAGGHGIQPLTLQCLGQCTECFNYHEVCSNYVPNYPNNRKLIYGQLTDNPQTLEL
jgi:hypothetical protein